MNSFFIITNTGKDPDYRITRNLVDYIQARGKKCGYMPCRRENENGDYKYVNPDEIPKDVEGIIVLGGDGTLLQVAVDTQMREIPIIGINLGNLGYLAEISCDSMYEAMDILMRDDYKIEHRMMLKGVLVRDGKEIVSGPALNDIFINKTYNNKMISLNIFVDNAHLNTYFADGIIVASPTGSTGYSLSAGGPIVAPQASDFIITPLAPHSMINRSVIVPSENEITIELGLNKYGYSTEAGLLFDGNLAAVIKSGDRVRISRSEKDIKMIKIYESSFMDVLSRKMRQ